MDNSLISIRKKYINEKSRVYALSGGTFLLILFSVTTILFSAFGIFGMLGNFESIRGFNEAKTFWIVYTVIVIILEAVIFWVGIIIVYISSIQLGIKMRILGLVLGWIPVVHLITLAIIISITLSESIYELKKVKLNEKRKDDKVCETKYPILLVHGVFFRDSRYFNYWGRIPDELEYNGATIFYGNHNSAASVDNSAKELAERINEILEQTGAEKLNVIAHSKGGLDMRTAIAKCDIADKIATLTTINTPHRGCEFADYLLSKIPEREQNSIAKMYNAGARKLGDNNPDFLAAVYDLTHENCTKRNEEVFDNENVFYQSFGSKINHYLSGGFPLNMSYALVKHFDGANDGLVGESSFEWGKNYKFIKIKGRRGISHADMIDLTRENLKGFDVREFYVSLVTELKQCGY